MSFRILLRTSLLEMWSLYEMPRRRLKVLILTVCIFLSISAEYKNMNITRERNSMIFEPQMILSFVSAAMVWAIPERISGMDLSLVTMAQKYLEH